MRRTLKFNLSLSNKAKVNSMENLSICYIQAVNYYLGLLSSQKKYILSQEEIKGSNLSLSYRYKQCAGRQAIKIWKSWNRNKKKGNIPVFNGSLILDQRFIEVEKSKTSTFDYWIKVATLAKGKPILIPFKSYDYANNYFKDWKLVNGGRLQKQEDGWYLLLTFEKEAPAEKKKGKILGIDVGIKKLMVASDKKFYGQEIENIMDKIQRKRHGSKAFKRALLERNYYINEVAKQLDFDNTKMIVMENIKDIKKNTKKKKRLRKEFRSKFQRWTYPRLFSRINQLCELNGVHFITVDPAYTSQTCNKCGSVHKSARNGEMFKCKNCDYTTDADYNASLNILNLGLTQQPMVAGNMQTNLKNVCLLN